MEFTAYRYYNQKRFKPNQVMECFNKIKSELQLTDEGVSFSGSYEIDDRTNETKDISITDLRTICEIKDRPRYVAFRFPDRSGKYGLPNNIVLADFRGTLQLQLRLSGPAISEKLFGILEECLELKQCSAPEYRNEDITNLEERFRNIEERLTEGEKQISCFLSYRFTARSKALALELTRFLQLLGVTVVSGAGYEPRCVDEKVIARLEQPCDFIVYLVTRDGESIWTRDELVYSLGKGYAVVLLVESGAKIGEGLLGNWEYLEFQSDHIGDTFVGILEALQYIKREKLAAKVHAEPKQENSAR